MTRPHNTQTHCATCGTWSTQESSFGRWIRENPKLDSKDGYCVIDQDYWIHAYKTYGNRMFQCLMGVEIKTMGAKLSAAQRDTLFFVDQIMRNRRDTPTNKARPQAGSSVVKAKSSMLGRDVVLKAFGVHVLTFSNLGPEDSKWIMWDKKIITQEDLTQLLRFNLDPDKLTPLDLRPHHLTAENQNLALALGEMPA